MVLPEWAARHLDDPVQRVGLVPSASAVGPHQRPRARAGSHRAEAPGRVWGWGFAALSVAAAGTAVPWAVTTMAHHDAPLPQVAAMPDSSSGHIASPGIIRHGTSDAASSSVLRTGSSGSSDDTSSSPARTSSSNHGRPERSRALAGAGARLTPRTTSAAPTGPRVAPTSSVAPTAGPPASDPPASSSESAGRSSAGDVTPERTPGGNSSGAPSSVPASGGGLVGTVGNVVGGVGGVLHGL